MNNDDLIFLDLLPIAIGVPEETVLGPLICNDKNIQNLKTTSEKEFRKVEDMLQFV